MALKQGKIMTLSENEKIDLDEQTLFELARVAFEAFRSKFGCFQPWFSTSPENNDEKNGSIHRIIGLCNNIRLRRTTIICIQLVNMV